MFSGAASVGELPFPGVPVPEDCFTLVEAVARDADDQAAGLQHWKQEYAQLSGGSFQGRLDEIWFGNIQLFRERTNQVLHESGIPWEGSRTIGVTVDAEGEGVFCGTPLRRGSLFTLGGSQGLEFRTPKTLDVFAVSVDAQVFREFSCAIWGWDAESRLNASGVLGSADHKAQELGNFLPVVFSSIRNSPRMLNYPQIRKGIEEEILNNLIAAISEVEPNKYIANLASRECLVQKARDYLLAHPDDPVTIADLCRVLRVSRRTLQYAFESIFDINPIAYLRAIRLNRVRRELKAEAGKPQASVGDVAARFGFWHLSRFAPEYRQLFGELPSETLRKGS